MKFSLKYLLGAVFLIAIALAGLNLYLSYQYHLGDGANTERLELIFQELDESNPSKDAIKRIENGDLRVAGCWGEPGGPYFPGVPEADWQKIRDSKQYWTLDGTTDFLESGYHHTLVNRAWAYARRYNEALKPNSESTRRKTRDNKPMPRS